MGVICNPGCEDGQIRTYATPCDVTQALRKGGLSRFILLNCEVAINDISDVSEWASLGASDYIYSPEAIGSFVAPETTTERVTCSPPVVTDKISGADFQIRLFDNTTFVDFDFEFDLESKGGNKTLLLVGCDGLLYYNRAFVPSAGENPGFGGLTITTNRTSEVGSSQVLNVNIRYNTTKTNFKAIPLTAALSAAIFK